MDKTSSHLVEFAQNAAYSSLPADVVLACKRRIVDSLGCMVGAYDEPLSRQVRSFAARYSGTPSASVLGAKVSSSLEAAAFANGVMLRYLDFSDAYPHKSRGHPSDLIAALVSVAESENCDGHSLINAVTLAYDVLCSFCETIDINGAGWDQAIYAGLAAAIGAGKLMGLTADQMGHAISLTLTPSLSLYIARRGGELSSWKGCAAANACRNAIFAVLLARDGFTGPPDIFEGKGGFWDMVGKANWRIIVDADHPHRVTQTHLKPFALAYHGLSAVSAALEIRPAIQNQEIRDVHVQTYAQAIRIMADDPAKWSPRTRETADHSLPYAVAAALLDGTLTDESFAESRVCDPAVTSLMQKIRVSEDPQLSLQHPAAAPARVEITIADGRSFKAEVMHPRGHAGNPMTDEEINAKFRGLFARYGKPDQCERVLDALWHLEQADSVAELWRLFVLPD